MSYIVADAAGGCWGLGANDDGSLTATATTAGADLPLADYFGGPTAFGLVLSPTLGLQTVLAAYLPSLAKRVQLVSPNGSLFFFGVTAAGGIITNLNHGAEVWLVGQLYPMDPGYPTPLQPGGAGTPVTMPQTPTTANPGNLSPDLAGQPFERTGKWQCNYHPGTFNSWEIIRAQIEGQAAALIVCPTCRAISRIVVPYESIHSEFEMAVFV